MNKVNDTLWAELTEYIISKGYTVSEWHYVKALLYNTIRQFLIDQEEAKNG